MQPVHVQPLQSQMVNLDLSQIVSYLIFDRTENKTVRSTVYNKTVLKVHAI